MIDIKFLRENPDVVRENIKKKFQDAKLPLVDEVLELDKRNRAIKGEEDFTNSFDVPVDATLEVEDRTDDVFTDISAARNT